MIDFNTAFSIANLGIVPFWLLLILAPRWHVTDLLSQSILVPIVMGIVYSSFAFGGAFFGPDVPEGGGFESFDALMILFTSPAAVFAGWLHYLVFDFFVGAWEVRDAQKRGISHILLIPCLLATFLLGPAGLLLYVVVRAALKKGGWRLDQAG